MSSVTCRGCGAPVDDVMVDLGMSPLANSYIPVERGPGSEVFRPLRAVVCARCFFVQLDHVADPGDIFSDYAYFSSWSTSWLDHARRFADDAVRRLGLGPDSLVVELASNDGYLLRWFAERGIAVLGVEPAANVAAVAAERGIPTLVRFFGAETANDIVREQGRADLVVANNVLAHVPDLHDFVEGISILLAPGGRATVEFPHLLRLVQEVQFDTIYHEHYSYLSLLALEPALAVHGLSVVDVERLTTHGGSLRVHLSASGSATEAVERVRGEERAAGLDRIETYAAFGQQVAARKRSILRFLFDLHDRALTVAGYGAPAKGNTLLNYCGIRTDLVSFTVDANPAKQGTLLPGSHIPVLPPDALRERRPDRVVLLPWNLRDELVESLADVRGWGGRFVVLQPEPAELA